LPVIKHFTQKRNKPVQFSIRVFAVLFKQREPARPALLSVFNRLKATQSQPLNSYAL
jgi:hypothetical protein